MVRIAVIAGLATLVLSQTQALEGSNLGGQWRFLRDSEDVGLSEGWQEPSFDDSAWETKEVPADWGDFDGIGWYRTEVEVPVPASGEQVFLVFDGVDDESRVFVEGRQVAECSAWNRRFFGDLTEWAGETVTVAVRVNDHGLGGGIHAPVTLVMTDNRTELLESEWHNEPTLPAPSWLEGSVIYEVFPRHFSETADFAGVTARLPELRDLGVDVIWLMPIHPIGELHRKGSMGSPYAMSDHMAINPDYGTEEDLHDLVDAAHELGMRVIIDAVLNHSSPDGVLAEEHLDWYDEVEDGVPQPDNPDWWDIADFDWDNPEVWSYFNEMMTYWVREFDIDGYRCDVAALMPTDFWEQLLPRLREIKPDVIMLAEADEPELHRASFHLSYNWTLYDALVPVLNGDLPASHLANAMAEDQYTFQRGALRMPFSENHDKERGPSVFGGIEPSKMAGLIALTVAEVPLLYNGQEVGENAERDIFETVPIDWSDPHGLRDFYAAILDVRGRSAALRLGEFESVSSDQPDAVFAFTRAQGDARALVVANVTSEEVTASLDGIEFTGPGSLDAAVAELGTVTLPPFTGDIWSLRPE